MEVLIPPHRPPWAYDTFPERDPFVEDCTYPVGYTVEVTMNLAILPTDRPIYRRISQTKCMVCEKIVSAIEVPRRKNI